jgi:hypothetical protein
MYKSFNALLLLASISKLDGFFLLGDIIEVEKFKEHILKGDDFLADLLCETPNVLNFFDFLNLINESKYFISFYPKEGFGLSVFFAMYFGSIVVCEPQGGYIDWLPSLNYDYQDNFGFIEISLKHDEISRLNRKKACDMLECE